MNNAKKNTRQTAGVVSLSLLMLAWNSLSTQARTGIDKASHARPKTAGRAHMVVYAAVSPDGRLAASYHSKNQICIWNKRTGILLHTVKRPYRNDDGMNGMYHYTSVTAITFSRTGNWLLVRDGYSVGSGGAWPAWSAAEITVWNARTGHQFP